MSKALVVYFSATGTTQRAANALAAAIGADIEEIEPAEAYTAADLDWRDSNSRTSREHRDRSARPELAGDPSPDGYDVIFLGYPLWWETAPRAVRTWLESHDFSGKKLITFATSSSSVRGADGTQLHDSAPSADWQPGRRISARDNSAALKTWAARYLG